MHIIPCGVLLMLLTSVVCAQTSAPTPVAVPNPGFENGGVLPAGWIVWRSGADEDNDKALRRATEADFIWDQAIFHSGARSLYIWNEGPRWAAWRTEKPVEVRSNTTYRLTVWIRKAGEPSSTYLRVRRGRWSACEEVNPRREWARHALEFKTPPDVTTLVLELSDLGGNGSETWFDDLDLQELPLAGK
jgi:hypothetical protein